MSDPEFSTSDAWRIVCKRRENEESCWKYGDLSDISKFWKSYKFVVYLAIPYCSSSPSSWMSLRTYHLIESSNSRALNSLNWPETFENMHDRPEKQMWTRCNSWDWSLSSSMILLSLLLYHIFDSPVPTEIIPIFSGTFSNIDTRPNVCASRASTATVTWISTTTRRPEGDASDKLISAIVPSNLTHCFQPTHPRRRPAFVHRFGHVLEPFLMKLFKTFFVAVPLTGVSSGSSNASCVVNQRNESVSQSHGVGLWGFMVLLPPSVCSSGASRPRLLVLVPTIPGRSLPEMIWSTSPQPSSPLLRLPLSNPVPALPTSRFFFLLPSPPSPVIRRIEKPKWCELGRSAHSRMYVRPAPPNTERAHTHGCKVRSAQTRGCKCEARTLMDAHTGRTHVRMRTWSAHTRGCEPGTCSGPHTRGCPACWSTFGSLPPLSFPSSIDSMDLPPCLLYSSGDWAPPLLILCTSAPVALLSFVPVHLTCRAVSTSLAPSVHLVHRPRRTARSCADALCHLRACVIYWHSGTEAHDVTSGHYIAHFLEAQKTVWSRRHWRESAHVAVVDVRAFLAESWCWRESSWGPRTNRWRWCRARPIEFDISLRTLPIEDREPFAVVVASMLYGVLVDALSLVSGSIEWNVRECWMPALQTAVRKRQEDDVLRFSSRKTRRWCAIRFCGGH